MDQAPCGPAVPCLSRQARAAVMVRLRGEADAGHRSAVSGHRSPVKRVIGRQCHSGVSVIRVNTGMVNFRKFLLPNKAVIFLKIFREIYICPNTFQNPARAGVDPVLLCLPPPILIWHSHLIVRWVFEAGYGHFAPQPSRHPCRVRCRPRTGLTVFRSRAERKKTDNPNEG